MNKTPSLEYGAIHMWVRSQKGSPTKCEHCGKTDGRLHWANISQEYKRELDDFMGLCPKCHRNYDTASYEMTEELKDRLSKIHTKEFCPKGHPLSGENLYTVYRKSNGRQNRMCVTCRNKRRKAYYDRVGK